MSTSEAHNQSNESAVAEHNACQSVEAVAEGSTGEGCCTDLQFLEVSEMIRRKEFKSLARRLDIGENKLEEIEVNCTINKFGDHEIVFGILIAWRESKGRRATQTLLIHTLSYLGRKDIVNKVFPGAKALQGKAAPHDPVIQSIQDRQREYFNDLQLPRILWLQKKNLPLEELYVELTMRKKDKRGTETIETIALEDLFQMEEEREDRGPRIFIEGHPGFGKTTLLLKVLSDWSRKQTYLFDSFYLAFLIPLRSFKGDLEAHFHQQCHGIINTKEEVYQTIESVERKVLVLLDGWDEATEDTKKRLVPLLRRFVYPTMTVVVTSRTGFYEWPKDDNDLLDVIGCRGYEQYKMWSKRFQVKGISEERRKAFLRKYLEIDATDLDRTIDKLPVRLNDFYCCPLFLLLLGVLMKEKKFEENKLRTKTQLYKTIFNFVVSRSLVKNKNLEEDLDVDLFDPYNSQSSFYRDVMLAFGRLCLQKLKAQSLSFEESEIVVNGFDVYDLGFLTKIVLFTEDEEKTVFEPIHKSFLEFVAAFYLSTIQETDLATEVKELFKKRILPTKDQLVYQFLCGLLDSDAAKLFRSLKPFNDIIRLFDLKNDFRCTLEPLLNEIVNANEETYNSLTHFVSKYLMDDNDDVLDDFPCVDYAERWVGPVVKLSSEIQITKKFTLNEKWLERLRHLNCLKSFRCNKMILNTCDITRLEEIDREIKCRKLILEHSCENPWKPLACMLEKLSEFCSWDMLSLKFYLLDSHKAINQFCEELTNGGLENVHIYKLSILGLDEFNFIFTYYSIENLLKAVTFGIKLSFKVFNKFKLSKFLSEDGFDFILSSHIFSLHWHSPSVYDLQIEDSIPMFTALILPSSFFKRQWKYWKTRRDLKNIQYDEVNNCIISDKFTSPLISYVLSKWDDIKKLSCFDIERIHGNVLKDWKGFDTIQTIKLNKQIIDDTFPSLISRFQNLRKLKINELYYLPSEKSTSGSVVDVILKSLSSLPHLNTLSIQCKDSHILHTFLERLSRLTDQEKTNIPLKKLVLNASRVNAYPMNEIIGQYKWIIRHKTDVPEEFSMMQRQQYKSYVRIPSLTWLEEAGPIDSFNVHLEFEDIMVDGEVVQLQPVNMNKLFQGDIHRILIEGSSPAENRIFCCKLLRDWTEGKKYVGEKFSLLFHIEANDFVNGASFEDVLIEKSPRKETTSKDDFIACITAYQHRVLLILESDKMNEETNSVIEPLLRGIMFPKMTIIVVCNNSDSLPNKYFNEISENDEKFKACFDRRVVMKLFDVDPTDDEKWLNMRNRLMNAMNSVDEEWATTIFNSCPLSFLSLDLMITKVSSTCNYKNYFNFIINTLLNVQEQVDLFNSHNLTSPLSHVQKFLHIMNCLGKYALQKMIKKEPATIDDNDVIAILENKDIMQFGILVKTNEVYEPIHESFTEFFAAFSTFNVLRVSGVEDFKREIERIVLREGLQPTKENILFFRFLGGFLNEKATLLFEALLPFSGWFNLQSESFNQIILEIVDIHPFLDSFRHLLTSFCPPLYDTRILYSKYRSSSIHSLLFNVALESSIIDTLTIQNFKQISLTKSITLNHLVLYVDESYEYHETDLANVLKCETVSVWFSVYFLIGDNMSAVLSALESTQTEKICFYFTDDHLFTNSFFLNCLHEKLMAGEWREKTIHRLLLTISEHDDPKCLLQLADLVKNNKIKEAVYLRIKNSDRNEEIKIALTSDLQELIDSIVQSGSFSEFLISNKDSSLSPVFDFSRLHGEQNNTLKSVFLHGNVSAFNTDKRSKPSVEEALMLCTVDRCILNLCGIKWLFCRMLYFDWLVKDEWQQLNELEELTLTIKKSVSVNPSSSNLTNLRVLTLTFIDAKRIPSELDLFLHGLLSSLSLRILQLSDIPDNISEFDRLVGYIVKGLDGKKENSNDNPPLDELLIRFSCSKNFCSRNVVKESKAVKGLQYLLGEKLIRQFSSVDLWDIPSLVFQSLFPLNCQFSIKQEVHGSKPFHSRHSQFEYRWMKPVIKYCITSIGD